MRVFISHSGQGRDTAFARSLAARLEGLGCDVWFDRAHLLPGSAVTATVDREIAGRPVFIVVVSPAALASEWVDSECRWAHARVLGDKSRLLLPVMLDPVEPNALWGYVAERLRIEGATDEDILSATAAALAERWLAARFPPEAGIGMMAAGLRAPEDGVHLGNPKPAKIQDTAEIRSGRGSRGYGRAFEKGWIYWSAVGGAHPLWGSIGYLYHHRSRLMSRLGFPLTGEHDAAPSPLGTTGRFQRFEGPWSYPSDLVARLGLTCGATVYWSQAHGAWPVKCGIGILYERLGGTHGALGFPTTGEEPVGPSPSGHTGYMQRFEGGSVWWTESIGAVVVSHEVEAVYHALGGVGGEMGFPRGPAEPLSPGGAARLQRFEGGVICLSSGS